MDTSSKSKTRTKSMDQKSVNGDEKEESQAAEKQEVSTSDVAADATSSSSSVKESETQERPVPSRKRKASEMKADDEVKTEPKDEEIKTEVEDEQSVSEGVSVSAKQTLGKGKRARIPNKRYSDISITGTPKSESKRHIENGETLGKENTDGAENTSSPMIKAKDSPAPPKKQKITSTDLSNPNYLKPFEHGWKRELVYRATSDNSLKRNGDIYYYTPTGKKVRSMREVAENLKNKELTLDDFTFFKEPLGLDDPEKEIIRDAKLKSSLGGGQSAKKLSTPKTPRTPKSNSPKPTTPAVTTPVARADSPPKTKTKSGSFKVKLPPSKGEKQGRGRSAKKIKEEPQEDMEVGMYPPNWSSPAKKTPGTKYKNESPEKKRSTRLSAVNKKNEAVVAPQVEDNNFMKSYMQNLSFGYSAMLYVFQYLKVQDLLRAGCVCTMWRDLASHPSLWRTVRMKNSQVHSFEGLAKALKKHGTVHLDLRKMLLPSSGDDIWPLFSKAIKEVDSLQKIELCRCPAAVVEQLAESNPKLQVLNAVTIKCESMSLDPLKNLTNLQELRLKSTTGLTLSSDVTALKELQQLTHLSLTSIKDLNKLDLKVIAELTSLESLDLGECTDFPKNFGSEILSKLDKLEKLRLEKGQGTCYTFEMLDAVKNMKNLEQLELVNFDIKSGFDAALGGCSNIKKLLIIPTYISQSATTNHMVLGGVLRLQNTLSHFVWGVTLELLRVTELFVDQCEDPEKKEKKDKKPMGTGDSIPVLKPVPLLGENTEIAKSTQDPPQVEILPLPNLQKLLLQNLPKTRVKILKIPFHATWRQTITDTVN